MEGSLPSFYTTASIARWVQRFRLRFQVRMRCPVQRDALQQPGTKAIGSSCCRRATGACRPLRRKSCARPSRGRRQLSQATRSAGETSFCFRCGLENLNGLQNQNEVSLSGIAASDSQLLHFDARRALRLTRIEQASRLLDVTTLLLDRLPGVASDWVARRRAAESYGQDAVDDLDWQKYLANLEHVLLCLQHVALVCMLHQSLETLRWDAHRTHQDWEGHRHTLLDWFTEWVGGRPPLNSTMPWNIKPSLVVLWGVCWMFYPPAGDWAPTQQPIGQGNVGVSNATGPGYTNPSPVSNVSNLQYQASATQQSPNLGNNPHPTPIGRMHDPNEPSVFPTDPMTQSANHMIAYPNPIRALGTGLLYDQRGASSAFSQGPGDVTPVVANTDAHTSSVAAPLTSGPSPAAFATAPSQQWRGHAPSFSRPFSRISRHGPSSIASEPAGDEPDISTSAPHFNPPYHDTFANANPYDTTASDLPTATSPYQQHPPPFHSSAYVPGPGQGVANYPPAPRHPTGRDILSMHSSQSYPSPQHSEASESASLGPVSMAPEGTPQQRLVGLGVASSPSLSRSTGVSRRASSSNTEPPRNAQGQIYCDHPECAAKPPTFSRKCEWTKHNDKHTRPYVCREPGCEKIRGFTYSGGLLRHQREVHRHHGGPRAPRFCPHPDCKRSTGQGFSRRENLNEHLRRVHRGVGIEDVGAPSPASQLQPSGGAPGIRINTLTPTAQSQQPAALGLRTPATQPPARKRQRQDDDDDSGDEEREAPEMPSPSALVRHQRQEIDRLTANNDRLRNQTQLLQTENQRLRNDNQRLQTENQQLRSFFPNVGGGSTQRG